MALSTRDRRRIAGAAARRAVETHTTESLSERVRASVVGQDEVVRDVCRFLLAGLARVVKLCDGVPESRLPHLDAMLIDGPSGCGKTLIVQRACEALGATTYTIDGSSLTGSGWRGGDLERHELRLAEAQGRTSTCRPTVVFIDEADKLARDETGARGFSPCQNLLRLIEGSEEMTVDSPGSDGKSLVLDKSLLVFVLAGAFDGIDEIVRRRLRAKMPTVGFGTTGDATANADELRACASVDDYMAWGLPRELVGRVTSVTRVRQLGADDMRGIVRGAGSSIEARFMAMMPSGCSLSISPDAAGLVASAAVKAGRGARGLEASLNAPCLEAIERARMDPEIVSATVTESGGELSVEYTRGERPATEEEDAHENVPARELGDEGAKRDDEPPEEGDPHADGGRSGDPQTRAWAPPVRGRGKGDLEHVAMALRSGHGADAPDPVATVSSSHDATAMADAIADVLLPDMGPRRVRLANLLLRGCLSYLRHWCAPEKMCLPSLLSLVRRASTDEGKALIIELLFDGRRGNELGPARNNRWGHETVGRTGAVSHFGASPEDDPALASLGSFWGIAGDDAFAIAAEVAEALERIA